MYAYELNIALNGSHWARVELGEDKSHAILKATTIIESLKDSDGGDLWNFSLTEWEPKHGRTIAVQEEPGRAC